MTTPIKFALMATGVTGAIWAASTREKVDEPTLLPEQSRASAWAFPNYFSDTPVLFGEEDGIKRCNGEIAKQELRTYSGSVPIVQYTVQEGDTVLGLLAKELNSADDRYANAVAPFNHIFWPASKQHDTFQYDLLPVLSAMNSGLNAKTVNQLTVGQQLYMPDFSGDGKFAGRGALMTDSKLHHVGVAGENGALCTMLSLDAKTIYIKPGE